MFKIKKTIPFLKMSPFFIAVSIVAVVGSLISFYTKGFNYGIDFSGGVKLTVQFHKPVSDGDIVDLLAERGFDPTVQRLGAEGERRFTIKTRQAEASLEATIAKVAAALGEKYGKEEYTVEGEESVGAKVGSELRKKGQLAIFITLVAILIYLTIRFDFNFSPGAVVALAHDVIVTMGILSLLGKEFNLTILAALLTIAGYSVNDTIVIFDRIRENAKRISPSTLLTVIDECLTLTLSRTIVTSLTVLIVVVILFFMGGGVIHDFAFTFIVGVIAGTYSTLFIASPIYVFMYRHWPKIAVKLKLQTER